MMENLVSAKTPKGFVEEANKLLDGIKNSSFNKYNEMISNPTNQTAYEHARGLSALIDFSRQFWWIDPQQVIYDLINANQPDSAYNFTLIRVKNDPETLRVAIKDNEQKTAEWFKVAFSSKIYK